MSRLAVYDGACPDTPVLCTQDPGEIAETLRPLGVRLERWGSPVFLPDDASFEAILDVYRPYAEGLTGRSGAGSADVISFTPDSPSGDALRQKFLAEHIHTEDEIRFVVRGCGNFVMHVDGTVYDAHCTQGDLISMPSGTKHWFDTGTAPSFTALCVFQDRTGWTLHYTDGRLSERFPVA